MRHTLRRLISGVYTDLTSSCSRKGFCKFGNSRPSCPDGLILELDPEQKPALEISLADLEEGFTASVGTVQLVVPSRSDRAQVGEAERYRSVQGSPVPDETTGQGAEHIPRLRPRLSLLVADEAPAMYQALPIARVRDDAGEFRFEEYTPPSPFVRSGDVLEKRCREVAEDIRRKAGQLAQKAAFAGAGAGPASRQFAFALNAGLLQLEAVLHSERCHPRDLYVALCHVAGYVTVLTATMAAPLLPRYNHRDLLAVFAPVLDFIQRALRQGLPESLQHSAP